MIELNLSHNGIEQTKVYNYLCQHATEALAEKIEHGVRVQKDGQTLISAKTLEGFMKYAGEQARKQAAKGANYAMIDDDVVYGWAMHYFEEDSILGDLYTEDGEAYKSKPTPAPIPAVAPKAAPTKPVAKEPSLFDWLEEKDEAPDTDEEDQEEEQETIAPLSFTQEPIEEEEHDEVQEETQVQPTVGQRQDAVPVEQPQAQPKPSSSLFDIFGDDIVEG